MGNPSPAPRAAGEGEEPSCQRARAAASRYAVWLTVRVPPPSAAVRRDSSANRWRVASLPGLPDVGRLSEADRFPPRRGGLPWSRCGGPQGGLGPWPLGPHGAALALAEAGRWRLRAAPVQGNRAAPRKGAGCDSLPLYKYNALAFRYTRASGVLRLLVVTQKTVVQGLTSANRATSFF